MERPVDFPCQKQWWYLPLSFGVAFVILSVNITFIPEQELNARFFFNATGALLESLFAFWLISALSLSLLYYVQRYASRHLFFWIAAAVYWLLTAQASYWFCVASPWQLIRDYDAGII